MNDLYGSGEIGSSLILGVSWTCPCGKSNVWMFDRSKRSVYRENEVYSTCCIHCDRAYTIHTGKLAIDVVVKE